jgi:GrpB-like predicted nucleotidyltransferase (UPF0157 family)
VTTSLDEPVHLVPYDRAWSGVAQTECTRIAQALGVPIVDLEHIGSTAVPGLVAKPVIDLMLGTPHYPPPPALQSAVIALGYEALGEAGVPGRAYHRLRGAMSFNLHIVRKAGAHWSDNLALRDYLTTSASARQRYTQAKQAALASGALTLLPYSAAKAALVAELLQEARLG